MESETSTPDPGEQTLDILGQAVFYISTPLGLLSFILPVWGKALDASPLEIGLFFSIFSLVVVVLRPLLGAWVDRHGRRPFFLAGLAAYTAAMVVFAFSGEVWGVMLARTVQGLGAALVWLVARVIVADVSANPQLAQSFGRIDQKNSQGSLAGSFLGFAVFFFLDFGAVMPLLFLVYAAISLATVVWAWRHLPETRPSTLLEPSEQPVDHKLATRGFRLLLLTTAVTAAAWAMLSPIMLVFLQEHLSSDLGDLAFAFLPAALIYASLPAQLGALADRFGRKPLMVLGMLAAAGTSFMIPGIRSLTGLALMWAFQALCYAAGDPAEQALVADLTGGDERGKAYGYYTLAAGLGASIGPLVGGWLYQAMGDWTPFAANGAVLAVCAAILWIWLPAYVPARELALD